MATRVRIVRLKTTESILLNQRLGPFPEMYLPLHVWLELHPLGVRNPLLPLMAETHVDNDTNDRCKKQRARDDGS
jgi:hypothetical protein